MDKYYTALDRMVGTVCSSRTYFENSISVLNDRLCSYLDQAGAELRGLLPHYFERHKTDGLDYLMHLGESLLEHGEYDPAYLKNLRGRLP